MTTTTDMKTLRSLPTRAAKIVTDYRKQVSATNGKELLTYEEKQKHLATLRKSALARLTSLRQESEEAKARLTIVAAPAEDHAADPTLSELQHQRTWSRIKSLLDTTVSGSSTTLVDPLQIVQEEIATKDPITLQVLRAELPSWLRANNRDDYVAVLPHFFDAGQEVSKEQEGVTRGWKRLEVAMAQAVDMVDDNTLALLPQDHAIPGFDDGALVTIPGIAESTPETDDFGYPRKTRDLPALQAQD